jgi:hypothetical protein
MYPLNPPTNNVIDVALYLLRILSALSITFLTLHALFIACSGVRCGLIYQHLPMKRTRLRDQRGCQWRTVPI